MNDAPTLTVYLAGPVSNCNDNQRTKWREAIKAKLWQFGHKTKDPTDHGKDWTPLVEMVDIDSSDVVIANLWRESIGTVVGIVQARRKGKPVILIDQN
jgi:nucleoside 2-deoxyribosyltransferase